MNLPEINTSSHPKREMEENWLEVFKDAVTLNLLDKSVLLILPLLLAGTTAHSNRGNCSPCSKNDKVT